MQSEVQLKKITNYTSWVIAVVIATGIPIGYFITSYNYESELLQDQANLSADQLSNFIYTQPDTWQYQDHRLQDILSINIWHKDSVYYRVHDLGENQIFTIESIPDAPVMLAYAALTDGITEVGGIETHASLRPLLIRTSVVAIFAFLTAWSIRFVLRVLPFAALERLLVNLNESHQHLEVEVAAKEAAFVEYRRVSDAMHHQVTHDALTGLPNRALFNIQLVQLVGKAQKFGGMLAVMIVDLNRFKEINDALGFLNGDKALCEVSDRLGNVLPDKAILARLGGDEFAILAPETTAMAAINIAESINDALKAHVVIDDYHLSITASVGIAYFPKHGSMSEELLSHADIAMQYAKQRAEAYRVYDNSYDSNNPNRLVLTAELRHAIDNNGLILNYQPKVDLSSGEIVGAEALARWHHPQLGFIAPDVFIPIAEQSGMINSLTEWVIGTAITQLSDWLKSGLDLSIAINISAHNLHDDAFSHQIKSKLAQHHLDPRYLTLEITEGSIMVDPLKSRALIENLASWGIKISIDDYGTGYSSLAYLKKLTVHELKIDRSFVMNMLKDKEDQIIVQSTIELAHNLNLLVVAEGVEDQPTYEMLKSFGSDYAQGFHICKPTTAEALQDWLLNTRGQRQDQVK